MFTFFLRNGILTAMKKKSLAIIIFIFASTLAFPGGAFKLGPYAGYFAPADENLKAVYSDGDVIYGLKMGVRVWRGLSVWFSGAQFKHTGETVPLKDLTTLTLTPLNLSLRYSFKLGSVNPYLAGGYSYVNYKERSVIGDKDGIGRGFSVDAGLEFRLSSRFSLDLGVRYSQVEVGLENSSVQLGGAQAGLSFLVVF